jgi:GWxTD domain-containing protein
MTAFEQLARTPLAKTIGWTLFHSLWEGALAALILLAVLFVVRSPRARYAWACAAMSGMLAGFALTFGLLSSQGSGASTTIALAIPKAPIVDTQSAPDPPARFHFEDVLPCLAPFWIAGVVVFHLRSVAAWMAAQRARNRGVCRAPDPWPRRLQHLSAKLRVSKPVALLETCLGDVPVVIGYLRPVILVPVGMLTGMPAAQAEAILLHELAHIQRHDYLVNLLQTVVEGFLFYHPAMWWISGVIRAERENCCDDLVVAASGDAREYAAALAALEQTRWAADQAALAATGGSLVKRIRRLLYQPEGLAFAPLLSAGILTIVVAGALVAWQASGSAQNQQAPATAPKVSPYTKWLTEDVVYIIDDRERATFLSLRTDAERKDFIEKFWLRRDPTPGTPENEFKEEHYRRIAFANNHYASRTLFGWKTDRGRMYILFGPPEEIEFHTDGRPASGADPGIDYPYEQWHYQHIKNVGDNVMMEFDDAAKTGEFKMTNDPDPSGAHRFVQRP